MIRAPLRAYAGPWAVIGLLVAVVVAILATTDALRQHLEDEQLRAVVAQARYVERDLIVERTTRSGQTTPAPAAEQRDELLTLLPTGLVDVVGETWAYQRTEVSQLEGLGASLVGDGITGEPDGLAPVVSLHTQLGVEDDVELIGGRLPDNGQADGELEVAVTPETADGLGVFVDGSYLLRIGEMGLAPDDVDGSPVLPVRISGIFQANDADAATWDHAPLLLSPGMTAIVRPLEQDPSALRGGLLTDPAGLELLAEEGLASYLAPTTAVRVSLDVDALDAEWAAGLEDAVSRVSTAPELHGARLRTGLPALVAGYREMVAAVDAVLTILVVAAVGTAAALMLVMAGLLADRRRPEFALLRARGARRTAVAGRVFREAVPVVITGALVGAWLLSPALRTLLDRGPLPGDLADGAAAAPVGFILVVAGSSLVVMPAAAFVAAPGTAMAGQRSGSGRLPGLWRLALEVVVVLVAGVGAVALRQRGLLGGGADPFLASVPLLLWVASGLVILRLAPWPARLLGPIMRRRRGFVGFLAVHRAGRAAPAALWALLVVVMSMAASATAATLLEAFATVDEGPLVGPFEQGSIILLRGAWVFGVAAAALAIVAMLVRAAPRRAADLGLFRALGMSRGAGRALVLLEVVPVVLLAGVGGLAVGASIPVLFGPAFGLELLVGPSVSPLPATWHLVLPLAVVVVVAAAGALLSTGRARRIGPGTGAGGIV